MERERWSELSAAVSEPCGDTTSTRGRAGLGPAAVADAAAGTAVARAQAVTVARAGSLLI